MRNLQSDLTGKHTWLMLLLLSLIFTTVFSCGNDDDGKDINQDCGCNSATISTVPDETIPIPEENQIKGLLYFKHDFISDQFYNYEIYDNRFWILQFVEGCLSCETHLIVCDEEILGDNYQYLKQSNVQDSILVEFKGNVKRTCEGPIVLPANFYYGEITLDFIKKI